MAATLSSGGNILSFGICQESDCSSFDFSETSSVYTNSNSGGWAVIAGAGALVNFTTADAISAYLTVTLPSGVICSPIALTSFPDDTGLNTQTITSSDLGFSGNLPDGIYSAEYLVNISNVSNQTVQLRIVQSFFLGCTIKCCVDRLIAQIPVEDCGCESVALKNALLAYGLYLALMKNAACGNLTNISNLLARLTKLCSVTNCGCS